MQYIPRDLRCVATIQRMKECKEGGGRTRGLRGVAAGTRPTVFKWKTVRYSSSLEWRDETTWKIGNGSLDAVHLCSLSMHRCYPAHAQTSTRYKQITESTTGKDKRAKCIPHVNKHLNALPCASHCSHQLLLVRCGSCLGSLAVVNREEEEGDEEEQLGLCSLTHRSTLLPSPVVCRFNPSLIPHSVFWPLAVRARWARRRLSPENSPAETTAAN